MCSLSVPCRAASKRPNTTSPIWKAVASGQRVKEKVASGVVVYKHEVWTITRRLWTKLAWGEVLLTSKSACSFRQTNEVMPKVNQHRGRTVGADILATALSSSGVGDTN